LHRITWPLLSTNEGDFLYLDINTDLQIKNHPKEDTYSKWTGLYGSLGNRDFDTAIPSLPGDTAILPEYIHYYGYYYQVIVQCLST
jgi:hypothetical protein